MEHQPGVRPIRRPARRLLRGERGSVTAETAIVLPVVAVLLVVATWAIGLVVAHIRCLDAARDVARAVARGETVDQAHRIGQRSAPDGAAIDLRRTGDEVTATVRASSIALPVFGGLGSVLIEESATVRTEPEASDE